MIDLVLDSSIALKWFAPQPEPLFTEADELRRRYDNGEVVVHVPHLLFQEILNISGRKRGYDEDALIGLAETLESFGFDIHEPDLTWIAAWTADGLTAYDATYVALADEMEIPLVTGDEQVLRIATEVAYSLNDIDELFGGQ